MKTAIYAHVSSESQAREGTIQSHLEALREYAKSHKLEIVEECPDDGFSGADLNRAGLDHLRDLAQEAEMAAVSHNGIVVRNVPLAPDALVPSHHVVPPAA